jgi:type IV pilus assembly protein PilE
MNTIIDTNMTLFRRKYKSGFTLIELMIAIAIIGIIAAIAYPSYQDSIRKARRGDAQADLIQFFANAERRFTELNSYAGTPLPIDTDGYSYNFSVALSATAYTIRATPTASQNGDGCGTMTLDQAGQRVNTGTTAGCW